MTLQVSLNSPTVVSLAAATTTTFSYVSTNQPLYIRITWYGDSASVGTKALTSVTYAGVALTRVAEANPPSWGDDRSEIWRLFTPTAGTANVVVTFNSAPSLGAAAATNTTNQSSTSPEFPSVKNAMVSSGVGTDNSGHIAMQAGPGDLTIACMALGFIFPTVPNAFLPGAIGGTSLVKDWEADDTVIGETMGGFTVNGAVTHIIGAMFPAAQTAWAITGMTLRWRDNGPTDPYGNAVWRTDGLIGYWRLGEVSGANAIDDSGHGRNGTHTSVSYGVVGPPLITQNNAIGYNGTSSKTALPASSGAYDFAGTSPFTVEAWVYLSAVPSADSGLIVHYDRVSAHDEGWGLFFPAGSTTVTAVRGSTTATDYLTGTVALNLIEWHYVTCTYDGVTLNLYIDGALDVSMASSKSLPTKAYGPMLAANSAGDGMWLNASIDEVAIYSVALSASAIAQHYAIERYAMGTGAYLPPMKNPGVFQLDV